MQLLYTKVEMMRFIEKVPVAVVAVLLLCGSAQAQPGMTVRRCLAVCNLRVEHFVSVE